MAAGMELQVLQEHTADLTQAIATNPSLLGQHLVQHRLAVQNTVTGIVDTVGATDYERGCRLLSLVNTKIEIAGTKENAREYFDDFLRIIAHPMGHRDLAELLVRTFKSKDPLYTSPLQEDHVLSINSPGNQQPTPTRAAMVRSNEDKIRALFTALVLSVQTAIKASSDVEDVRDYLITFFGCNFPETTEVRKLFAAVSLRNQWNYQHHSPLESVANHFLCGNREIEKSIEEYKASLSGFYVTTRLIDYIESQKLTMDDVDDESDDKQPPVLSPEQCKQLKVILQPKRKITALSLEYVHKLWRSFAEEYDIPSLTVVLERVGIGSLEITWRIPTHHADKIVPRSRFFRDHGIVLVSLDNQVIYDEEEIADYEVSFLEFSRNITTVDIDLFSGLLTLGVDPNIFDEHGKHPLFHAVYHGRQDCVEQLIEHGADVDLPTKTEIGEPPLITAVRRGNYQIVKLLLVKGAMANKTNKGGIHSLFYAIHYGRPGLIELLIEHGANVNLAIQEETEEPPLITAIGRGNYQTVELLLLKGAMANKTNKKGKSPLGFASYVGRSDIVSLLLKHHAKVDLPTDDELGETPLCAACKKGHVNVATVLIRHGAVVDYEDKKGATPLCYASLYGYTQLVDLLVTNGADVNKGGLPPLYGASQGGRIDIAKILVSYGAKIDRRCDDKYGSTPLMAACVGNHLEVVSFLIESGANINLQNKDGGFAPIHIAIQHGRMAVVKLLLKSGALLEIKNKDGRTPLILASWMGRLETVIELLKAGALSDTQDQVRTKYTAQVCDYCCMQDGLTSLIVATYNGHIKVVAALLDAEADPNITENTEGWSAVFFAANLGRLEMVQLLLSGGAKVDIKDKNGLTPDEVTDQQDIYEEIKLHSLRRSGTEDTAEPEQSQPQEARDNANATPNESKGLREPLDQVDETERREVADEQETIKVDIQDQPKVMEEKRRGLVKESYQRLLKIFDVLKDDLVPSHEVKKLYPQRMEVHSNIKQIDNSSSVTEYQSYPFV